MTSPQQDSILSSVRDRTPDSGWQVNLGQSNLSFDLPRKHDWWSGLEPSRCPGFTSDGKLTSLKTPSLASCSRQEVRDYFNNGWTLHDLLFSGLIEEESFYRPPYHELRHPLIFYFVHPAVFYVNKLRLAGLIDEPIDQTFESLFDIGVDEMSWDDMSKNNILWPSVDSAIRYRARVHAMIVSLIDSHAGLGEGHDPIDQSSSLWSLFMCFEHERIHIETSSALIRELPLHLVKRPDEFPGLHGSSTTCDDCLRSTPGAKLPVNQFVQVAGAEVEIGKPRTWPSFGWDNEYGQRAVSIDSFSATKYLISNAEFYAFVEDGGYQSPEFWTEEGYAWRSFRDVQNPTFWVKIDGGFKLRTIFEEINMPWSWPVVINFHEAKAYALWKSIKDGLDADRAYRLLTEAEHLRLRQVEGLSEPQTSFDAILERFNVALKFGSESPVTESLTEGGQFADLFGNVWQWLEDHFYPLSGFEVHPYYDDFSTPCFDGKHQMILGGSFISIGDEASPFARFHFRPHFFQHAGFRLVKDDSGPGGVR